MALEHSASLDVFCCFRRYVYIYIKSEVVLGLRSFPSLAACGGFRSSRILEFSRGFRASSSSSHLCILRPRLQTLVGTMKFGA